MTDRCELGTAPPARRALAELLPHDVAVAAIEFLTGPLLANPQRVGRPLGQELSGIYSARLAREWGTTIVCATHDAVVTEQADAELALVVPALEPASV